MNHEEILTALKESQQKAQNCFIYWAYEVAIKAIKATEIDEDKVEWRQYAKISDAKHVCELIDRTANHWDAKVPEGPYWPWERAVSADDQRIRVRSQNDVNSDKRFIESSRPSIDRFMR